MEQMDRPGVSAVNKLEMAHGSNPSITSVKPSANLLLAGGY